MTNQEATEKIQNIIQQLREFAERLENMKRLEEEGRRFNEEQYEIVSRNELRELSYKVGYFFETRKPMKESHKLLRKKLEEKVKNIVTTLPLNEYIIGVSVSFVSAPPVNFEGPDWQSDAITGILSIRIAIECGIDAKLLQQYKDAFKVDDKHICAACHEYGKMKETVFNSGWITDVVITQRRTDFEAL